MYKKLLVMTGLLLVSFSEMCMGSVYKSSSGNKNIVFDKAQFPGLVASNLDDKLSSALTRQKLADAEEFYKDYNVDGENYIFDFSNARHSRIMQHVHYLEDDIKKAGKEPMYFNKKMRNADLFTSIYLFFVESCPGNCPRNSAADIRLGAAIIDVENIFFPAQSESMNRSLDKNKNN